jgi:protein phosphatase
MIKVKESAFLTEVGKRANNEDALGFIDDFIYVVCDGVGGNEKGEIASNIVKDTFLDFSKSQFDFPLEEGLRFSEGNLSQYLEENPEARGMATTLTVLQILSDSIHVAWVGDSRIYQFRKGSILFKTEDHSWVNEAVIAGIITPEEAINHPKSNIITRAVQGQFKPTELATNILTDVDEDDIFLLCSDGILESWPDDELNNLFLTENDCNKIVALLNEKCSQHSKDNYTAIVLKIEGTIKPKVKEEKDSLLSKILNFKLGLLNQK